MAGGAQDTDEPIVGINVTPLVDIVLVLLIIFMVTAKMIVSQAIPLDLPKASTASGEVQTIFSVVLAADGRAQVDSKLISGDDAIFPLAQEAHKRNPDVRAVIKADSQVSHGRVIHVLDLLRKASFTKVAFGVSPVAPTAPSPSR